MSFVGVGLNELRMLRLRSMQDLPSLGARSGIFAVVKFLLDSWIQIGVGQIDVGHELVKQRLCPL